MIIDVNSWHYKAWKWTYSRDWHVPQTTDFCSYMRRLMFLVPGKAVYTVIAAMVYGICILFPTATARWLVGYKTVSTNVDRQPVQYSGLQVAGREILPWHVALPALVVASEAFMIHKTSWAIGGAVNAVILAAVGLVVGGLFLFTSSSTQVFRSWFWAKKRKICPVIEFGDHYDAEQDHDFDTTADDTL